MDLLAEITAARGEVADLLIDRARLDRDPDGLTSATVDPDTLELDEPDDDSRQWTGPVLLTEENPVVRAEAAAETSPVRRWIALLPHTAPLPREGDTLTLTVCKLDTTLVGLPLRVTDVRQASLLVLRRVVVERA